MLLATADRFERLAVELIQIQLISLLASNKRSPSRIGEEDSIVQREWNIKNIHYILQKVLTKIHVHHRSTQLLKIREEDSILRPAQNQQ